MKPVPRVVLLSFLVLASAVGLSGCLVSEEDDYTLTLSPDGRSGTLAIVQYGLESDQREPARQREDFDELMRRWKGDEYLLEKLKEGLYVKDRDLSVTNGRLVWREVSLVADVAGFLREGLTGDTLRFALGKEETVVSTNGSIVRLADSTTVSWPANSTTLRLRVHHDAFRPTSDFVSEFRRRGGK